MNYSIDMILRQVADPFYQGQHFLGLPNWAGWTFGSLFVAIGILCFFFIPSSQKRVERYKAEQLENYNKQYNKNETNYNKTGMYLPLGEKMKAQVPAIIGVTFILLGITWIVGQTITTL